MVVSPELADVLSAIICRIRDDAGAVPLAVTYDYHERIYGPPHADPVPKTRRPGEPADQQNALRDYLDHALAGEGRRTPVTA